jgi:hypothetical protein
MNDPSVRVVEESLTLMNIVLGHTRHDGHWGGRSRRRVKGSAVWLDGGRSGIEDGQLEVYGNRRVAIGGSRIRRSRVDRDKVDLGSDVVGSVKDKGRVGLGSIGGREDERGNLLSTGRVGHGAGDVNVTGCTSHSHISLVVADDGDIIIVTSAIPTIPVSSTVVTMSVSVFVVTIVIMRPLVEWGKLLFLDLTSGNDPDSVSGVARLDVDGSSVPVAVAIVVDDGIGILSVVVNHIDLGRVSLVVVAVDNNGISMSAGLDNRITVSASLYDSGIMSVASSLDNSGLVVVASRKERLDLVHDR